MFYCYRVIQMLFAFNRIETQSNLTVRSQNPETQNPETVDKVSFSMVILG